MNDEIEKGLRCKFYKNLNKQFLRKYDKSEKIFDTEFGSRLFKSFLEEELYQSNRRLKKVIQMIEDGKHYGKHGITQHFGKAILNFLKESVIEC